MAQNNPLALLGFGKKPQQTAPAADGQALEGTDAAVPAEPAFSVVSGNPTDEELAALTAVVLAAQAQAEADKETTWKMWQRRLNNTQQLGLRLRPGPGSWKRARPQ